jgi:hypothetical protein
MSKCWQLGALMKKNLILMKRSCFATCCEIIFPIILMFLLVAIRRAVQTEIFIQPTDELDFMKTNSTALIEMSDLGKLLKDNTDKKIIENFKWNGLQIYPPL